MIETIEQGIVVGITAAAGPRFIKTFRSGDGGSFTRGSTKTILTGGSSSRRTPCCTDESTLDAVVSS